MSDSLQLDPVRAGQAFGWCGDSKEQADFLNEWGRAMVIWDSKAIWNSMNMQLAYIVDKLDGNGVKLVRELAGAIDAFEEAKETAARKIPEPD